MKTETIYLPFRYGYGDSYQYAAKDALWQAGYFPEHNDSNASLYSICRELGIEFTRTKYEDQKKADVVAFGKAD